MTNSAIGFIQALLENPDDLITRAIFADWLEDRNDPRAVLVRLCLRLAEGVPEVESREALWAEIHTSMRVYAETLPQRLRRLGRLRLHNGLYRLNTTARRLTAFGAEALSRLIPEAGIETIHFEYDPVGVHDLLARKKLAGVAGLDLNGQVFTSDQLRAIEPSWLAGLVRLDLSGTHLTDVDLAYLIRRGVFTNLGWLDLRNNRLHGDEVLALLDPKFLPRLRYLGLHGNPLRDEVAEAWYRWRRERDSAVNWHGLPIRRLTPQGVELRLIPAGAYQRGTNSDRVQAIERPQHRVEITRPFYLALFPTTQAQVMRLLGVNRSHFRQADSLDPSGVSSCLPMEEAGRDLANNFCVRLSEHPDCQADGLQFRLPTEAEWEYACRAHEPSDWAYAGGRTLKGTEPFNHDGPGGLRRTTPVGSYQPNAWGLFDMHGNVWDWVADFFSPTYYAESPVEDPPGPESGTHGLLRGGSWFNRPPICRITYRCPTSLPAGSFCIGFRVAATINHLPLG
jgi:uncharacterized protein (TIGR02996 family)